MTRTRWKRRLFRLPVDASRLDREVDTVSMYIKNNNSFVRSEDVARDCPHCGVHAQLIPLATPPYDTIMQRRPKHVGIVFSCAACQEPRFGRLAVRGFERERVELSSNLIEIERTKERFPYSYLPKEVERLFREALDCYSADCLTAFAAMCRRTVQTAMQCAERHRGPHLYDLFRDVALISDLDVATGQLLETTLFMFDTAEPPLDAEQSAVLVEIVKDMLYQCFVRTAKLRKAMKMRRFFAGEPEPVASIKDRQQADSA